VLGSQPLEPAGKVSPIVARGEVLEVPHGLKRLVAFRLLGDQVLHLLPELSLPARQSRCLTRAAAALPSRRAFFFLSK